VLALVGVVVAGAAVGLTLWLTQPSPRDEPVLPGLEVHR
jgi:hypothetical protein